MRIKCGLVATLLLLSVTFDSLAQEQTLTKEDVTLIENRARPRAGVAHRLTRTNLIIGRSQSPFHFLQIEERSPSKSIHTFTVNLKEGKITVVDTYLIGNKVYTKTPDSAWNVSELSLDKPFKKTEEPAQILASPTFNPDLAKQMLEVFAAEDEIIKRFDPDAVAKVTANIPQPPPEPKNPEVVKILHDKNRLLDKTATVYYEVDRRGKLGTGSYTMIRRIWINKDGTLARSEFEYNSTFNPWTQLMTDVYEYDPNIKIEAPIK